ncbi:MAG: hypothetical protein ACKPCM_11170 [Pseudanabaena sp.]
MIYSSPREERIYLGKDGRRFAPPILTYLGLPDLYSFLSFEWVKTI